MFPERRRDLKPFENQRGHQPFACSPKKLTVAGGLCERSDSGNLHIAIRYVMFRQDSPSSARSACGAGCHPRMPSCPTFAAGPLVTARPELSSLKRPPHLPGCVAHASACRGELQFAVSWITE